MKSKLKEMMAIKKANKAKKKAERSKVASINQYKREVPRNYRNEHNQLVLTHEEVAGRCMTTADMMARQTNGNFLRLYAEPEAIPLCYMLFAYHQNCMVVQHLKDADVIVEIYEKIEAPHIMGTKDDVVYLALFKYDEGEMPWMV